MKNTADEFSQYTVGQIIAGIVLAIIVTIGGIALVGWLGVLFAYLTLGIVYPVWYGFIGALLLRVIAEWFRK